MTPDRQPRCLRFACLTLLVGTLLGFGARPAVSAVIEVAPADLENAPGACSLRDAVRAANEDIAAGGCRAGSGLDTLQLAAGSYRLAGEELVLRSDLVLIGAGGAGESLGGTTIDAVGRSRVLRVLEEATVELRALALTGGLVEGGHGGGLLNEGSTTMVEVTIADNLVVGGFGGGLYNAGILTLLRSTLTNNEAQGGAGADAESDSTVDLGGGGGGGGGAGMGGAFFNDVGGTALIRNSTFSGNRAVGGVGGRGSTLRSFSNGGNGGAPNGGLGGTVAPTAGQPGGDGGGGGGAGKGLALAVFHVGASGGNGGFGAGGGGASPDTIISHAVGISSLYGGAGGSADSNRGGGGGGGAGLGGAIFNRAVIELSNSTIAANSAIFGSGGTPNANSGLALGGGVFNDHGALSMVNSIVFGNSNDLGHQCATFGGTVGSDGYNLFAADSGCPVTSTDLTTLDARLGPLAANGGPTSTHALTAPAVGDPGSPAVDAGSEAAAGTATACESTDQRLVPRPQGTRCDIGAFELGQPDLAITKAASPATALAGTTLTYTVSVENSGAGPANGVVVTDTLPTGLSGASTVGCAEDPVGVPTCTLPVIPAGGAASYTISALVDLTAPEELINTATTPDPVDGEVLSASVTSMVIPPADLSVAVSDGVTSAVPGQSTTYTIQVSNAGPGDVDVAEVDDVFPSGLSCLWGCVGSGGGLCTPGQVAGDIDDTVFLPAGASLVYTAVCTLDPNLSGPLSNTATVTVSPALRDPFQANNSGSDLDTVLTPQADLAISKTDGQASAVPGESVTYTIDVANELGPSDLAQVQVEDDFPTELESCTWSCSGAGGGSCDATSGSGPIDETISLPVGGSASYQAACTIAPAATGTLSNTATVTAISGIETNPANNSATDDDVLTPMVDLVTVLNGPAAAFPGAEITYQAEIRNDAILRVLRNDPATGASRFERLNLPAADFEEIGPVGFEHCTDLRVDRDGTWRASCDAVARTGRVTVKLDAATGLGREVGPVEPFEQDPLTARLPPAGLSLEVGGNPQGGVAADRVLRWLPDNGAQRVFGPMPDDLVSLAFVPTISSVAGAAVTDNGLAELSCTWLCTPTGGATCTTVPSAGPLADTVDLPIGSSLVYDGVCTVSAAAVGTLTEIVTVTVPDGVTETDPNDNNSFVQTAVLAEVDLGVAVDDGVTAAVPGGSLTYQVVVSNEAGPGTAFGAVVTDDFPTGLSCVWTCAASGGATCASGQVAGPIADTVDVPLGGSITYTAACDISSSAAGTLTNTASVLTQPDFLDPVAANNTASDIDTVLTPQANLAISKTDGVDQLIPGAVTTYVITAANPTGPSDVGDAVVSDPLVSGITACTWSCSEDSGGSCSNSSGTGGIEETVGLPVGGSVVFTSVCSTASSATGSLSNTAVLDAGSATELDQADNSAVDTDTLTPTVDLLVTLGGPATGTPGGSLDYQVVIRNEPSALAPVVSRAPAVTVSDVAPVGLSCSWLCSPIGGAVCNTVPIVGALADSVDLPAGSRVEYSGVCTVDSTLTGSIVVSATAAVSTATVEVNTNDNDDFAETELLLEADLSVSIDDGVDAVTPGESVTYSIVVENAGPSDVVGATVEDFFPSALDCTWSCTGASGAVCTAGPIAGDLTDSVDLPIGSIATYTATCSVDAFASGSMTNTVTVSSPADVIDPDSSNDEASDRDKFERSADLSLTQLADPEPVLPGGELTYTLTIANAGPSESSGSLLIDVLPEGVTLLSGATTGFPQAVFSDGFESGDLSAWDGTSTAVELTQNCGSVDGVVNCVVPAIAPGESAEAVLVVRIDPGVHNTGDELVNSAVIDGFDLDSDADNDTSEATTTIGAPSADLDLVILDSPDPVARGATLTYTLTVTNLGPSAATSITLEDPLPFDLDNVVASGCSVASNQVTCSAESLLPDESIVFEISATVSSSAPPALTNEAVVSAAEPDPDATNNLDVEVTTVTDP